MNKLILSLILILSIIVGSTAVYASDNIFSMTEASGAKGAEVTIDLKLDRSEEFASANFILEYDASKLKYVKNTQQDIFKKAGLSLISNDSNGKVLIGYVSNPSSATSSKSAGKMLSITFKILTSKDEAIPLTLKVASLNKDDGSGIEVSDIKSRIIAGNYKPIEEETEPEIVEPVEENTEVEETTNTEVTEPEETNTEVEETTNTEVTEEVVVTEPEEPTSNTEVTEPEVENTEVEETNTEVTKPEETNTNTNTNTNTSSSTTSKPSNNKTSFISVLLKLLGGYRSARR